MKGWLVLPRERREPLSLIVQYAGYGGGRGLPLEHLVWATAGHAHFVMDSRGQGVDTPDAAPAHPASPDGPTSCAASTIPTTTTIAGSWSTPSEPWTACEPIPP